MSCAHICHMNICGEGVTRSWLIVCVVLLYLLLTWFFENGPGTSPYAVHASVFSVVWRVWSPLETKVLKLAFKKLHCLNLKLDVVCFWYPALIPISDDLLPSNTFPYQQEPNQKTVNAKYAMQRRKRPTWWEGGSGRYAMWLRQGNKHGESYDGSTCLSGRKASIKVSIDHLQAFVFWEGNNEIWDMKLVLWMRSHGKHRCPGGWKQHGKICVGTPESAFDSEGSGF